MSRSPRGASSPQSAASEAADDPALLSRRKVDHLELCARSEVEFRDRTTLLEEVHLLHDSLPEIAVADIDLRSDLAGLPLRLPLMISGMTGGAEQARNINRLLAAVAQRHGMAFGVGSQRAMLRDPAQTATYQVRDVAPDVVLCGNIGAVQAAACSTDELKGLVEGIGANLLCIHLNPGQEIVQDHGDRDFRGALAGIERAVKALPVPVVVKETGCGMSPSVLRRLREAGVATVDVSGAGGTTWVGVEALRGSPRQRALGQAIWDWGIPTAAAIGFARREGLQTVASGGLRNGLDAARAIALGADVASAALPWLRAAMDGGEEAVEDVVEAMRQVLLSVCLLTGSRSVRELQRAPRHIGPTLAAWMHSGTTARSGRE